MGRSRPASHTRTPRATALRASSPRSATGSRVASPAMTLCVRLTAPVCQTQAWKTDGFLNERKRGVVGGDGRLPPCRTPVLMAQQQPTGTQLPPAAPGPPAPRGGRPPAGPTGPRGVAEHTARLSRGGLPRHAASDTGLSATGPAAGVLGTGKRAPPRVRAFLWTAVCSVRTNTASTNTLCVLPSSRRLAGPLTHRHALLGAHDPSPAGVSSGPKRSAGSQR